MMVSSCIRLMIWLMVSCMIDGIMMVILVANFAVKVTKQGCLSLCHFVTDSAWHWSNKGGSLHFCCITPNLTSFYCQSPVKSCKKRSLWMYFPDLLCPTRWILCKDACWSIRSSSHNKSLISVGNMSLTKCDKGDKAKLALSLCCQLCCQLWHGN